MHAFVCTDLVHAFASPDKNCLFVKSRNLRLALPVMHLPYSSLIFLWRGLQNYQPTRHFKRYQKRVNAVLNASFLLSTCFITFLVRLTKVEFSTLFYIKSMWVGAVLIISLVLSGFCIILRVFACFCVKNRKWSILQWILRVRFSHLPSRSIYY